MSRSVTVASPAKINLQLGVGPLRADGFHTLATVYQAIELYDEVTVTATVQIPSIVPGWNFDPAEKTATMPLDH
jgi:4-diphosphocytidyl-2-C-methyl-D-erythritol kinase